MSRPVKLGLVQFEPERWNVRGNWDRLRKILSGVPEGDLDLVITPECIIDGYAASGAPKDPADTWPERERWLGKCALDRLRSDIIRKTANLSRRIGTYLVLGYTELIGPGRAANAASVFDRSGNLVATYHKTHLQKHDLQFELGQALTIVDADFGRFGVLICADRRWPEVVRCLRLAGAEMVANPTYGMHDDLNLAMMRTRAYENGFFIAFAHPKLSLVTGPGGEVEISVRSEKDALIRHTVDLEKLNESHIVDRRTDLYRDYLLR